jgi:fatty-acyl-CoA synthase
MDGEPPIHLVEALGRLPRDESRGFRFLGQDRVERYFPYHALEAEAYRRAAFLSALGLHKGDRVALVLAEPHQFVLSFLGAVVGGFVPVPIYPRASFKNADGYVDTLAHIVAASGSTVLLCGAGNREVVERLSTRQAAAPQIFDVAELFADDALVPSFTAPSIDPGDLCFLQFTSGSTSKPKGVMVTHQNLVANTTAFLGPHGLDRRDTDVGVSWLPLFHDMGLIGFVLGPLICDIPIYLMPTELFARSPRLWLDTLSAQRGTLTYAPNFAYQLAAKRVKAPDVAALDLSCVRVAGCGAEPIRAATLRSFARHFAPAGFDERAFLPSYGMAESTLAITFHEREAPLRVDRVSPSAMREGRAEPAGPDEEPIEIVGCGKPFPGHDLRIVDESGVDVGERVVGEVLTRGPSVTSGYFGAPEATADAFLEGYLRTGDLAYFADGDIYICGRRKDLIIVRGENHYPQDIEWAVGDLPGVRRGNVIAFATTVNDAEELVVAAEAASHDAPDLRAVIQRKIIEEFGLRPHHVAIVAIGSLPKTSSGKIQRQKARLLYEDGALMEHP